MSKSFDIHTAVKSRLTAQVYRIIQSDLEIASVKLSDGIESQNRLEELIDDSKPRMKYTNKHFLIRTPFRYPPLKHGSRFGTTWMPSFFYASKKVKTCMAESAYYHFRFAADIKKTYPKPITKNYLVFSVRTQSYKTLDLTKKKYHQVHHLISHSTDYSYPQMIGKLATVDHDFNVIKFNSARHISGVNVAISTPDCIQSNNPQNLTRLIAIANESEITFKSDNSMLTFPSSITETPVD